MTGAAIPDDLRRFLQSGVLSVPHVEAVLLLRGDRTAPWDARRLSSRLYLPEPRAGRLLLDLARIGAAAGVDDPPQNYCYRPATAELAVLLDQLDVYFARNLVEVTRLIHAASDPTAHQFAAAFRFRKGP
jgi:hypothetical protein